MTANLHCFRACCIVIASATLLSFAPVVFASEAGNKEPCYLSILNAMETGLKDRWQASVDVLVNGDIIRSDLRIGEKTSPIALRRGESVEIDIRKQGSTFNLASFKGKFDSETAVGLLIAGNFDSPSEVVIENLPDLVPPVEKIPPGSSLVTIYNSISSYPVQMSLGQSGEKKTMRPKAVHSLVLKSGEHELLLWFPLTEEKLRPIRRSVSLENGTAVLLAIHGSSERGDRPSFVTLNMSSDIQLLKESELAAAELNQNETSQNQEVPPSD